jgi:hypothetical protein
LGGLCDGKDYEDLYMEAVRATLAGDRRWRKSVSFVQHLIGAMKSISSHWAEERSRAASNVSPQPTAAAKGLRQRVESTTPCNASPEFKAVVQARIAQVESLFDNDLLVRDIIDGLKAEMTGPEIQQVLGISEKDYWTAMRRMRRLLDRHLS